jgi:hypothetical protein
MESQILAQQGKFKEAVAALVREAGGGVSFVEIVQLLEPHMTVEGDRRLTYPEHPMIVLWDGMSHEFCQLMQELVSEHVLKYSPTEWLVYMADRVILTLPLATEVKEYQEPHWLPVVFDLVDPHPPTLDEGS